MKISQSALNNAFFNTANFLHLYGMPDKFVMRYANDTGLFLTEMMYGNIVIMLYFSEEGDVESLTGYLYNTNYMIEKLHGMVACLKDVYTNEEICYDIAKRKVVECGCEG